MLSVASLTLSAGRVLNLNGKRPVIIAATGKIDVQRHYSDLDRPSFERLVCRRAPRAEHRTAITGSARWRPMALEEASGRR